MFLQPQDDFIHLSVPEGMTHFKLPCYLFWCLITVIQLHKI